MILLARFAATLPDCVVIEANTLSRHFESNNPPLQRRVKKVLGVELCPMIALDRRGEVPRSASTPPTSGHRPTFRPWSWKRWAPILH